MPEVRASMRSPRAPDFPEQALVLFRAGVPPQPGIPPQSGRLPRHLIASLFPRPAVHPVLGFVPQVVVFFPFFAELFGEAGN